jgi:phosphoribosylamine--glycine ligase
MAEIAECVDIQGDDLQGLLKFAKEGQIGLTVVGPEAPLVAGIVDLFESEGLKVFGPNKAAAAYEGSKRLTKEFLVRYEIPTPRFLATSDYEEARMFVESHRYPLVIKADGLAAGKGVFICESEAEALIALHDLMIAKKMGDAGRLVVIEDYVEGTETSVLCFADGNVLVPMRSSRDYKRALDDDKGMNTGGMGAFSPNPAIDAKMREKIERHILQPIMKGFKAEGVVYRGILYVGIMITQGNPKVLEFNVRFGDPETQVLLPRLKSDIVKIMLNCSDGLLNAGDVEWLQGAAVCVVLASGGYPGPHQIGKEIFGLGEAKSAQVLHAGTRREGGRVFTAGGRVLSVCATGADIASARKAAYRAAEKISFEGMQYRKDIALI